MKTITLFKTRKNINFNSVRRLNIGIDYSKLKPGQMFIVECVNGQPVVTGIQ